MLPPSSSCVSGATSQLLSCGCLFMLMRANLSILSADRHVGYLVNRPPVILNSHSVKTRGGTAYILCSYMKQAQLPLPLELQIKSVLVVTTVLSHQIAISHICGLSFHLVVQQLRAAQTIPMHYRLSPKDRGHSTPTVALLLLCFSPRDVALLSMWIWAQPNALTHYIN